MKHEIITLDGVQIIGMAKEIAFCKGWKSRACLTPEGKAALTPENLFVLTPVKS